MIRRLFAAVVCIVMLAACTKENEETTRPFLAPGLWKGYVLTFNCAILNRENGTCRMYYGIKDADTTTALERFDGTYTVTGDIYKNTLVGGGFTFETTNTSTRSMRGIFFYNYTGEAAPAEFIKQ